MLLRLATCTIGALLLCAAAGCSGQHERLFEHLEAERTGIGFVNAIPTDDSLLNPLDFFYVYNGGGVAAGDLNDDGWTDLYFAGNAVENRLYLNRGDFRFDDVTDAAGVGAEDAWSTGLALVDINDDGLLDIYVCVGGPTGGRANRLYVNGGLTDDGTPVFTEQAERYGIADTSYTTHAAFFDADGDGDLDLYVLNTDVVAETIGRRRSEETAEPSADRLYRNDGDGSFTDVSAEAGIDHVGYGLGLAVVDVNQDGRPDLYVANDFISKDLLYVNEGDGTFTNRSAQYLKHQSYSSMGVDAADVDNDLLVDILVLDMLPTDSWRRRVTSNAEILYEGEVQTGRNTLQLNRGLTPEGRVAFSEVGQMAGVAATDWSWAPLFADFNNDGDRDLYVTNGYGELVTHLDFERRRSQAWFSGTPEQIRRSILEAMKELPQVIVPNRIFENEGALAFTDRTGIWNPGRPAISNGAAFADLDRDGDLDIATNNVNEDVFVLENLSDSGAAANFLRLRLHGPPGNRAGLGTKLVLRHEGGEQVHDHSIYRGYQSTVESIVHFGLGADSVATSLHVIWPDGSTQTIADLEANRVHDLNYESASAGGMDVRSQKRPRLFREVADSVGLAYRHRATEAFDFQMNPLLPHRYSGNGPGIAVGDVDGNGLDDVFVGADAGHERFLFLQTDPGTFHGRRLQFGTVYEDMGALLFDADNDEDLDLYVVSGGFVGREAGSYEDRLYLNDGSGAFTRALTALPEIDASGSVVTAADFDGDGDLDLFVGGRVQPGTYPLPPRSFLLRNDSDDGQVRFTDVTEAVAPGLGEVGLVADALWTDYDNDGRADLLLAGEWMPITVFQYDGGTFRDVTSQVFSENTAGWWNSLAAGDFDHDGDVDYVAGNLGLNTRYAASSAEPVRVYAKDFDGDARVDAVLSEYRDGIEVPAHSRDELTQRIVGMLRRFPTYASYAEATFDDVLTRSEREGAYVAEAVRFESSYFENMGDGTLVVRDLPTELQVAPIFGMRTGDFDADGRLDLFAVGNWYAPDAETGRADAFVGAFLRGDGQGDFQYINFTESGFFVDGDAKGLAEVAVGGGESLIIVSQHDGPAKAFRVDSTLFSDRMIGSTTVAHLSESNHE